MTTIRAYFDSFLIFMIYFLIISVFRAIKKLLSSSAFKMPIFGSRHSAPISQNED